MKLRFVAQVCLLWTQDLAVHAWLTLAIYFE
jgi:hypothetical protein